ncbi:ribonuclease H-like domain-containing protein [Tanacetum coccineum]
MTHPSPKRNMVPKAVLMRSGLVSLTTARPVNTAQPKTIVNSARPMTNVFNKAHSTVRRPINNKTTTKNSNFNQRVNTVSGMNVNTVRPKAVVNVARPKAVLNVVIGKPGYDGNPQQDLEEKGVIDSGCSRHMTRNMSYLTDFEELMEDLLLLRFSWVFFLATKDETSGILKSFITRVENLTYQRVKVIRCDNGTEFKNKEMNQFCKRKGKFDGKADEGFFVGYSINSKAFRVFNSRTRIVEENLHVQFRNQSNGNAGAKACDDAGEMETVPGKEYILLPLWPADLLLSQSSKSSLDDGFKPS